MEPLAFDPSAEFDVDLRGTFTSPMLVEATLRALADGRHLIELHDESGHVVASISLRPAFMLRRETGRAEAAA